MATLKHMQRLQHIYSILNLQALQFLFLLPYVLVKMFSLSNLFMNSLAGTQALGAFTPRLLISFLASIMEAMLLVLLLLPSFLLFLRIYSIYACHFFPFTLTITAPLSGIFDKLFSLLPYFQLFIRK